MQRGSTLVEARFAGKNGEADGGCHQSCTAVLQSVQGADVRSSRSKDLDDRELGSISGIFWLHVSNNDRHSNSVCLGWFYLSSIFRISLTVWTSQITISVSWTDSHYFIG